MNVSPSSLHNKIQSACTVLFEKKIDTESRSTKMPKLSLWMVVLISISSVICLFLVISFSPPHLLFGPCSLSIHFLVTYSKLYKNKQQENKQWEFELPPFWLVTVPKRIEIFYTQSLVRSIVLLTFTCERHHLEPKSHDKLFISASKVDTPPNIDSQTFLSRDTETPVATSQPQ